jgi:hypothetical protein
LFCELAIQENTHLLYLFDQLFGLVVRAPGYRSGGPGSIAGTARFSGKKWVWNGVYSTS